MVLSELAPTAVTSVLSDLSTPTEVKKFPAQNNDLIYFCELDGSSRLCVIIFAYEIVKCLLGKTFRTILLNKLSV